MVSSYPDNHTDQAVMYTPDLPRRSTGFALSYTGSYRMIPSAMALFMLLLSLSWRNPSPVQAAAAITDPDEVASLQSIAQKMGFKLWDFSVDPCSGENGWNSTAAPYIACECTVSNCHVTVLNMYNLNLVGEIPLQITNLTHLKELTMGLNIFTGSIPIELGRLSALTKIDFGINQLSGSVPSELGNLTNLDSLGFGSNNLSGVFPKALGNLTRLTGLYMDGSGLSGELPVEFGKLTSLKNVWMFGNQFSGRIPDVFGDMSQLSELRMYGNNFTGPIPSSILKLPSMVTLSIGDLLDGGMIPSSFKILQGLKYLSLRNNNLRGTIPEDLGSLSQLQYLDLSFNNLTGGIPESFASLENLNTLFLGNNSLTGNLAMLGQVPSLMSLDVSNNQMSGPLPTWVNRSTLQANLLWNLFDQSNDKSRLVSAAFNCLDLHSPCDHTVAGKNLGFSINCGGPEVTAPSTQDTYSADSETLGNASFFQSEAASWGVSNIGYQYDSDFATILSTTSIIQGTFDQALYNTARGSASSLRYYGIGMVNGAYNVELHFAEIAITADTTSWKSQGRRIFDVYIQGFRVLKDFDIHAAANGSFRAVVKNFSTEVTDTVLEVHFLWSGKGTCCSPTHWTYGPLISAIRVYADFHVQNVSSSSGHRKVYVIVGAVLAGILIGFVIIITAWRKRMCKSAFEACKGENQDYLVSSEFSSIEAKPHIFTYNELRAATEDFHVKNKLGEGGFGAVFKGTLLDGTAVAVKMLSAEAEKGNNEFMNEAATISAVQHRNLVKLLGCCVQGNHKILVFEFLENNSLSQTLLEKKKFLDWPTRFSICVGIARGLTYLHEESRTRIVHRDIKASNILLDQNLNAKIGDFGLAKLFQDNKTHISTRVAGTIGYLAPEYAFRGKLTEKADVYSFGILLLEIVSGRGSIDTSLSSEMVYLLEWTWELYEENRVVDLADASLEGKFSKRDVERVIQVALLCTQAVAAVRPKMSEALSMLTGNMDINLNINRPGFLSDLRQFSLQQNRPTLSNSTGTTIASSSTSSGPFYSHAQISISQVEAR